MDIEKLQEIAESDMLGYLEFNGDIGYSIH